MSEVCKHGLNIRWCGDCDPRVLRVKRDGRTNWTEDELQLLREHLADFHETGRAPYTQADLARLLGRSRSSIQMRLAELRMGERYSAPALRKSERYAVHRGEEWTSADLEVLLDPRLSGAEAAQKLGRTLAAVYVARSKARG